MIKTSRTIRLANSAPIINGKQRYAVNSVSFVPADTPLKIADYYKIPGVFTLGSIPARPSFGDGHVKTSVMAANFRDFVEIVFENYESVVQSWHIDGYAFFVVGYILSLSVLTLLILSVSAYISLTSTHHGECRMDGGKWSSASRKGYNLKDAVARSTVQVRALV